jgi:hypothetical protein
METVKIKKYKIIKINIINKNNTDYKIFKKNNQNGGSQYTGFIDSDYSDLKYNNDTNNNTNNNTNNDTNNV